MFHTEMRVLVYISFTVGSCTCVTSLYGASGIITSENFPFNYPDNSNEAWLIYVTSGNSIRLTFSSFFLESNSVCQYDYVEVRENSQSGNSLTGKLCGRDGLSRTVISTSSLYIVFHSDTSNTYSGFRAEYVQSGRQYCSFTYIGKYCDYGCCNSISDCCTLTPTVWSGWSGSNSWSGWSGSNSWSGWSGSNSWSGWSGSNSWSSWSSSYYDDGSTMPGWRIGVIVSSSVVGLAIVSCIIRCIVNAAKSPTRTTVVRPIQTQPSVTVVSTAQQGASQAGTAYPANYGPPGAVPPQYYNNPAYPPPPLREGTSIGK